MEVIERGEVSNADLLHLEKASRNIADCADSCSRNEHCDFVRADLVCELRELDEQLRDSVFEARQPAFSGGGRRR